MKICPFCAEEIKDEAIKCRYCGEFFDEKSLHESETIKKAKRVNLGRIEVAEYLCVPLAVVDAWVHEEKIPFSRIADGRAIFRKSDIDSWIDKGDVTAYSRYVSSAKKITDILPEGYRPPSDQQEWIDYAREVHEKYIGKHARKDGVSEEEYARIMKKEGTLRTITTKAEGGRIKLDWDSKKLKYLVSQGEEVYIRQYKKDKKFEAVIGELSILMCILDSWY